MGRFTLVERPVSATAISSVGLLVLLPRERIIMPKRWFRIDAVSPLSF